MPRFSVRIYDEYCTEFHVDAPTPDEAQAIAEAHENDGAHATQMDPRIKHVFDREYVGSGDMIVQRLDEQGNVIEGEEW